MQVCIFSCPLESRFWISLIIFSKQSDWEAEQKPASPQEKWHNKRLKYLQKITMFQFFSKNRETPQNGWFIVEHPLKKMDDLGGKPTIFGNIHIPPVLPSTKKKNSARFFVGWKPCRLEPARFVLLLPRCRCNLGTDAVQGEHQICHFQHDNHKDQPRLGFALGGIRDERKWR